MLNNNSIKKVIITGVMLFLLFSVIQSCSTTMNIPRSEFGEIDESEQQNYEVQLKNGTRYNVTRMAVGDSLLTVLAINSSRGNRNQALISDKLPYSILLDEVESIKLSKSSSVVMLAYIGIMVLAVSLTVIVLSLDFSKM